jgi:hypothetical protein
MFALHLWHDRLDPGARSALPATNRVLYVLDGALSVDGAPVNSAWYGAGACSAVAGPAGATVLRYELVSARDGGAGTLLLAHDIALDPSKPYLMRCDGVDFDLGAEALPHRHKGGDIRCLVQGLSSLVWRVSRTA